jgi:hypothetical protein
MHSFFTEQIAGKIADIKNVGEGRYGGAITAATRDCGADVVSFDADSMVAAFEELAVRNTRSRS